MAFHTIRHATRDDHARLDAAARRFVARWLDTDEYKRLYDRPDAAPFSAYHAGTALEIVRDILDNDGPAAAVERGARLRGYWRRAARRALRHDRADEIAYRGDSPAGGYVGYSVD